MDRKIEPYSVWKHFKGGISVVIAVAVHSETGEEFVIYRCTCNNKDAIYARNIDMFLSEVDHKKYPDVKQKYRFEKIN